MRRGFAEKLTGSTNAKPNVAISKRVFVAAAIAVTLPSLGCGDSLPKAKPAADADGPNGSVPANRDAVASVPAEIVSRTHAGVVGALERPAALRRFFESLVRLESEQAQDDVRIVQFGDSHTAADIETATARHALQTRFGDGGRGFVAIGKPWKQYLQEGVRCGMSSDWSGERGKLERGKFVGDGMYGLAGIGLGSSQRGARAWTDITARTSRAEINYLEQPNGGSFDVFVDGIRVVRVSTRADRAASAFRTFDVTPSTAHQVEVRGVGDGDVRVFGLSLDRAEHGIVFDALGINGARVTTCLQWNEQHWGEQLKHRAPALVILAYGTNESTDEAMSPETYERQLVDTLGRIARAVPSASCLLLGPPDRAISEGKDKEWMTAPKLLEIIASQKRVAAAAGCAFYDQLTAMGGSGTIAGWASEDPPRAQKDRVHLTREGYAQLGSSFASDLMRAYVGWRKELGLPPTSAPAPALEASQ